jgi:hypothetical protein
MFVGFVYQENSVHYMLAELVLAVGIVTAVGHFC